MSLVTGASLWSSGEATPSKRVASLRTNNKTIKKMPELDPLPTEDDVTHSALENEQDNQDERNKRVNQMLDNMTNVMQSNDADNLADFTPMPNPNMQSRSDFSSSIDPELPVIDNVIQTPPHRFDTPSVSDFSPNAPEIYNQPYQSGHHGNLRRVYEPSRMMPSNVRPSSSSSTSVIDNRVLEKINYAIHLLEQQQNEKTSNIFEEFVLYALLGVFLIYIVDSFAKTGKYTR